MKHQNQSAAQGDLWSSPPISSSLIAACFLLTGLFTVIKPEASLGLDFGMRLLFWASHIGVVLGTILLASYLMRAIGTKWPTVWTVAVTGCIGAILAAPALTFLEMAFPVLEVDEDTQGNTSHIAIAVLIEFLETAPIIFLAWLVVNLPLLFARPVLHCPPPVADPDRERREHFISDFKARLPDVIGSDIVAISSDLHYLNVHTALGKALILGSLKACVEGFGEAGLLVHRSHWVAKSHVVRIVLARDEAYCLMSTGARVPISRRHRKAARACFGDVCGRSPAIHLVKRDQA